MRICINALSIVTGGGLTNLPPLVGALAALGGDNSYLVLAPAARAGVFPAGLPNVEVRPVALRGGLAGRLAFEQLVLQRLLSRERVDLLFSPANVAPLRLPRGCHSVVKVQNIAPFSETALALEPDLRGRTRLRALRRLTLRALAGADAAIFISEMAAALLRGRARRAHVIYDGLSLAELLPGRQPAASAPGAAETVALAHGLHGDFVLCVADFYPYKNLTTLIRGFALLPAAVRGRTTLVLVGRPLVPAYAERVRAEIAAWSLGGQVRVIEGLPHGDLVPLYRAARVYAFPSQVEAGGTTLVEAMAAAAPVVASNAPPMPEFCGPAALYCDQLKPGEWATALERALTDVSLAGTLGEAGRQQAARFRWDEAALQTLALFESVVAG